MGKMMQTGTARRQFLKTVGVGALTSAGLGMIGSPIASAASGDINPSKSKLPRLLAGCCAYSYNHQLRSGQMTLEDFFRKAVELRVDAVDVTGYYLASTDPAYLSGIRHLGYKNALTFSGAACGVSMVQADSDKRADSLNEIKKWVDITDRLGAPHLRVFAGKLPSGATTQMAIDWVVETMKVVTDYSGQKGITIGIEDHQGVTQSADVCLEVMQRVNSPYAGINLDITHFVPTPTQDAYAQIAACIPYATNTHIRDKFDDGTPIDLDRVGRSFAEAGFRGYMSAEYEGRRGVPASNSDVPKLVAEIQVLCRKYSSV